MAPRGFGQPIEVMAGPTLMGCVVTWMIFGLYVAQLLTFIDGYTRKRDLPIYTDPALLVGVVTLALMIDLPIITYSSWNRFIMNDGKGYVAWVPPSVSPAVGVLNGIVAVIVQWFFARRVWSLSGAQKTRMQKIIPFLIAFCGVVQLAAAIATGVIFAIDGRRYQEPLRVVTAIFLSSTVLGDGLITGAMVVLLRRYKRHATFSSTQRLLNTLTRHTLENAFVTTLCAVTNMIVYYALNDNVHIVFQYMIGFLYGIVLVTSINRSRTAAEGTMECTSRGADLSFNTGAIPLSTTNRSLEFKSLADSQGTTSSRHVAVAVHRINGDGAENESDEMSFTSSEPKGATGAGRDLEWDSAEKVRTV